MKSTTPKRTRTLAAIAAVVLLSAPGCLWAPELSRVRSDIQGQLPGASFQKTVELTLGPLELALARLVTAAIPEARQARTYLRDLSRVQIGIYEADVDSLENLRMPQRLQSLLDDGWEVAVRVREAEESVWLLCRADEETVREVFIVVLNADELVMVKARGRLENLVSAALRESRGAGGFMSGRADT